MYVIGHYRVGKYQHSRRYARFIQRIAEDLFEKVGAKDFQSVMCDRSYEIKRGVESRSCHSFGGIASLMGLVTFRKGKPFRSSCGQAL